MGVVLHQKINSDSEIKTTKEKIKIVCNDGVRFFYNLHDDEKQNKNKLAKNYQSYLKSLSQKNLFEDEVSIYKINHLRDSITANMIGILNHLQKQYPGIISLENMDAKKKETLDLIVNGRYSDEETGNEITFIEDHFVRNNQDVSRRLEFSLFRKFQYFECKSLVPANIKQTVLVRNEFVEKQFGIVQFVKIGGTSSNCPNCGNNVDKTGSHLKCNKFGDRQPCGFDSSQDRNMLEKNLRNSDEVAAYNVAKNAFDKVYNEKK